MENYKFLNGINVLSLFDGISCGRLALERAGIKIKKYYASEIEAKSIKVSKDNYPDIIHLGDINNLQNWDLENIDLIIGGSPCQNMSRGATIGDKKRLGLMGEKSSLFWKYLEALNKYNPKHFLLENVVMPEKDEEIITMSLGVSPIRINSSLVSFQKRDRLYWTNIPNVKQPIDKKISFQDYKDKDFEYCSKFKLNKTKSRIKMWGDGINGSCPNVTNRDKINCITLKQDRFKNAGLVEFDGFCRYLTTRELELAQTLPVGYTKCLSKNQSENVIGNGWTVDIISHILEHMK